MIKVKDLLKQIRQLQKENPKEFMQFQREILKEVLSPKDIKAYFTGLLREDKQLREEIVKEVLKDIEFRQSRRSFLTEAVGAGLMVTGLLSLAGVADARTIITDQNVEIIDPTTGQKYWLKAPLPVSAEVFKEDGWVKALDAFGSLIAKGKSGVDDSVVIQKTVDVVATSGGGVLKITGGEYYVGDILLKRKVSICGEGYSTILYPKSGATTIFKWKQDTMTPAQLTITSMLLDGQGLSVDAIWLEGGYWFRFRDLRIYNFKGYGVNFAYVWDSDVISCVVENCGSATNSKAGVALGTIDNTNGVKLIATHVGACEYANVYLTTKAARIYILGCKFETGDITPEWVLCCEDYSYRNFIANSVFAGNANQSVVQLGISNTFIGNEVTSTNRAIGIKTYRTMVRIIGNFIHTVGDGIYVQGTSDKIIIADNVIDDTQGYGIYFNWQPNPFIVEGNMITNVSGADAIFVSGDDTYTPRGRIEGNYIEADPSYAGITVGGVDEVEIVNNTIIGGTYSIKVLANSNNINVIGNKVTAPINMLGSGVVKNNIGYPTDSFLQTGVSVAIGGGAYGSPTTITSLSGIISSFDVVLHVTAGAGEVITVKFECVWDDGSTTYITKSLDNSSGTAATSQDFEITTTDKISLWKNASALRKINIYAMSSLSTPTTDAKVTVDIAGSG